MCILTWDEVKEDLKDKNNAVLLGNGFSMSYQMPNFNQTEIIKEMPSLKDMQNIVNIEKCIKDSVALIRDDEKKTTIPKNIIEELNKGINPINKKTNIKEAGELYLRLHASTNCKPSTYKTYEGYLNNIIVPFFGDLNINEISPILIKEFMKQMQDAGRANATVNKYIKFISAIYNFMIDSDITVRNPLVRIKSLKEVKNKRFVHYAQKKYKHYYQRQNKYIQTSFPFCLRRYLPA